MRRSPSGSSGSVRDVPVLATSSATGAGVRELAGAAVADRARHRVRHGADRTRGGAGAGTRSASEEELAEHMVFRPGGRGGARRGFAVERLGQGSYRGERSRESSGCSSRYDIDNEDALAYLEERLRRIGVLDALRA